MAKIGLSENLPHLPHLNFAKITRREKFPIYGSLDIWASCVPIFSVLWQCVPGHTGLMVIFYQYPSMCTWTHRSICHFLSISINVYLDTQVYWSFSINIHQCVPGHTGLFVIFYQYPSMCTWTHRSFCHFLSISINVYLDTQVYLSFSINIHQCVPGHTGLLVIFYQYPSMCTWTHRSFCHFLSISINVYLDTQVFLSFSINIHQCVPGHTGLFVIFYQYPSMCTWTHRSFCHFLSISINVYLDTQVFLSFSINIHQCVPGHTGLFVIFYQYPSMCTWTHRSIGDFLSIIHQCVPGHTGLFVIFYQYPLPQQLPSQSLLLYICL